MRVITIIGTVTIEALEKYPNLPSQTLARKLFVDNPEIYSTVDNARSAVRYYRGQAGKNNRKKIQ
jgi:hypothetical protein